MQAPSPMTKPARVASNGREARGGYSSSAASPRIAQKPARMSGWIARLRAAGQHGVGVAAPDQLGRLPDRARAGRARRHDRVVRPAEAQRDRELPAGRVDEHARDEERRDAVGAALAEDVGLLHDPRDAADRRADDDADAVRVERRSSAGVRDRLARGGEREHDVAVELAHLLRRRDARGSKSFTSAAIRDRELARVERRG